MPLYTQLNSSNKPETVTQTSAQTQTSKRKRHHRTNSRSPRSSGCSRSSRCSTVVDAETQTEYMDVSETDLSPSGGNSVSNFGVAQPQKVSGGVFAGWGRGVHGFGFCVAGDPEGDPGQR